MVNAYLLDYLGLSKGVSKGVADMAPKAINILEEKTNAKEAKLRTLHCNDQVDPLPEELPASAHKPEIVTDPKPNKNKNPPRKIDT